MSETAIVIKLDPSRLMRYTPVRVVKIARIVTKADSDITVITAEWGEDQQFVGTYVEILDASTGDVKYGSAYDEWMDMHERLPGCENLWFKTAPVDAYVSDEAGTLITTLADGTVETTNTVQVGDYIVRQKNGEVQKISAAKFPVLYDVSSVRPIPLT